MPKTSPRNTLPRKKSHIIIGAAVLLLISIGVGISIWHYEQDRAIAADRARFERADQDVQQIANDIVTRYGEPLKNQHSSWCSRPNLEFKEATLGCNVENIVFYTTANAQDATAINMHINSLISSRWVLKSTTSGNNGATNAFSNPVGTSGNKLTDYQSMSTQYYNARFNNICDVTSSYYLGSYPPFDGFVAGEANQNILAVAVGCRDNAKVPYFRLK